MEIWLSFLNFFALGPFGPLFWLVVTNAVVVACLGCIWHGRAR